MPPHATQHSGMPAGAARHRDKSKIPENQNPHAHEFAHACKRCTPVSMRYIPMGCIPVRTNQVRISWACISYRRTSVAVGIPLCWVACVTVPPNGSVNFPWLAENGMLTGDSHECCLVSSSFDKKAANIHVEPYQPTLKPSFEFIPSLSHKTHHAISNLHATCPIPAFQDRPLGHTYRPLQPPIPTHPPPKLARVPYPLPCPAHRPSRWWSQLSNYHLLRLQTTIMVRPSPSLQPYLRRLALVRNW
jgi:hypothetical protein